MTSVLKGFGVALLVFVVCCSYTKHATFGKDGLEYMPNRYGFTRAGRICIRAYQIKLEDRSPERNRKSTEDWGKNLTRYLKSEFTRVGLQTFDADGECPDGVQILGCILVRRCIQSDYFPFSGKTISIIDQTECELSDGGSPSRIRQYSGTGRGRYYIYSLGVDFNTRVQAGGEATREMIYAIVTDTVGAMDKF